MTTPLKIDLRVRDLKKREDGMVSFEGEDAARAWLEARPPFVEVLGVASWSLPGDVSSRLKAAMRPLDDAEKLIVREIDLEEEKARLERDKAKREKDLLEAEAHKQAMKTADPNRPMEIHWTYDDGMKLSDQADPRPINEEVKIAVLAWIEERNDWVRSRGQMVGEANLTVWPGKIPDSEGGERVKAGRFFPCTAPESKRGQA
jgi:hypothetical protein